MQLKMAVKIGELVVVGISVVVLLAMCSSHNNPLKTAPPNVAAKFLMRASQAAEKKLHVFLPPGGYYYGECMRNKVGKALCAKLYKAMANFATTTQIFQGVTVSDLTDKQVFKKLKADYRRTWFNAV